MIHQRIRKSRSVRRDRTIVEVQRLRGAVIERKDTGKKDHIAHHADDLVIKPLKIRIIVNQSR